MRPTTWNRVKALFDAALQLPPEQRASYIASASGGDERLRLEVASLLSFHHDDEFMESPAFDVAEALGLSEPAALTGTRLGAYRMLREIGRGGMGSVYLAERADDEYHGRVAIKVVKSGLESDLFVQRFRRERQILASLAHPNIARLLDGGTTAEGLPFCVMEYIEGEPITAFVSSRRLDERARLGLFRRVCDAVAYAHKNLVVHRDITPANILVTETGAPMLLDFGIAQLLAEDASSVGVGLTRAMTPGYASPEQARGDAVTTQTDVYSLGVVLRELLAEQANPELAAIIDKATREDAGERYPSVDQLAEDIDRYLSNFPVHARPDTMRYRSTKFIRRNPVGVTAGVLLALSLLGGIIGTGWQARRANLQRARAERRFGEIRSIATSFMFEMHDAIQNLPGSTRAREMLVGRAQSALDVLAREASGDPSLQRELATAYVKVGDVQGRPYAPNLGNTAGALDSYRKAVRLLEVVMRAAPRDTSLQTELSVAHNRVSSLSIRRGDLAAAVATGARALALSEQQLKRNPANEGYQKLEVENSEAMARALYSRDAHVAVTQALPHALRGVRMAEVLMRKHPRNPEIAMLVTRARATSAYCYWIRAGITKDTADYRAALNHHLAGRAAMMAGGITDARAWADLSREIVALKLEVGEASEAVQILRGLLPTYQKLVLQDPQNSEARRDLAQAHSSLSVALNAAGDKRGALEHARAAQRIVEQSLAIDPSSREDSLILSSVAAAATAIEHER